MRQGDKRVLVVAGAGSKGAVRCRAPVPMHVDVPPVIHHGGADEFLGVWVRAHAGRAGQPGLASLWRDLRCAALYFLRERGVTGVATCRREAKDALRRFALKWEEVFGTEGCTYNLHVLACRLAGPREGLRRGAAND